MSLLNQKFQLNLRSTYQWWGVITYLALGLMAGSLLMSGVFVYNYTFRTLEDAHTIVLLNTDTVANNVNLENFQKATDLVSSKSVPLLIPNKVRNIFSFGSFSTSTSETVSSSYVRP